MVKGARLVHRALCSDCISTSVVFCDVDQVPSHIYPFFFYMQTGDNETIFLRDLSDFS